jgi:hypothetical protein
MAVRDPGPGLAQSCCLHDRRGFGVGASSVRAFEGWATPPGWNVNCRIVSATQMGDAAGVVLLFGEDWIDFRSPVRVNRVWKVTDKTATHSSR